MKTTIISIFIFLILLGGGSYLLKDQNIPLLSMVGKDINSAFFEKELKLSQVESQVENNNEIDLNNCGTYLQGQFQDLIYESNGGNGNSTTKIPDYDKSEALTCMGEALVGDCNNSEMLVIAKSGTAHTEKIRRNAKGECTIEVTYGFVNEDSEIKYENSSLVCSVPRKLELSGCGMSGDEACTYLNIKNSPAHTYIQTLGGLTLSSLFSPQESVCSGTIIDNLRSGGM